MEIVVIYFSTYLSCTVFFEKHGNISGQEMFVFSSLMKEQKRINNTFDSHTGYTAFNKCGQTHLIVCCFDPFDTKMKTNAL